MVAFSSAIREFLALPDDSRRLGPYRCKDLLDKAGTAPVFKAVEEHAGHAIRSVAIKIFDGSKTRVVDEARTLCRVQHPNVIRFHTLTTDPKRGLMGLVMELAEGISVDQELETIPKDDDRRIALAVEIGIDIASALDAAHEAKVVHCNVKPSNIMLTAGTHKLINFGIAASLSDGDEEEKKLAGGTTGYVDPVCVKTGASPNEASDLYSLGATLYECLAGNVPAFENGALNKRILEGDTPARSLANVTTFSALPADFVKLVDSLVAPARDDRPRTADNVRRSLERMRSLFAGRDRALPPEERGPFPGLDRYEATDRDVFFGRVAEVAGVLELCRTRGLIGIVGISGSGKSSLTRAGVVLAIEEGALGGWPTKYRSVLVTPGSDLMAALDAALSKVLGGESLHEHPEAIAEQLASNVDAKGEGIVILIDQLEELVIRHDATNDAKNKSRRKALDLLSRLAEAPVGLRVIVAVRRDLLDEVLAIDPHFSRALSRGTQLLSPLTASDWEEVLDQALDAYGYRFEDASVRKEVLTDLKSRDTAMTLIQFGLSRLWASRDTKKKAITKASLSAKDGMRGALESHATAAITKVTIEKPALRDVLLAMTTPEGTRAHLSLTDAETRFGKTGKDVVLALAKARLVASETEGFTYVHDCVLREWKLLRDWIEDARDDRLLLAHIERDAARWTTSKDSAELWRKGRLAAAIDLWKQQQAAATTSLSDDARAFLTKSMNDQAKVRVAFWFLVTLVVLLIVGGSLIYAKESRERADQARRDADALQAALTDVKRLKQQADENGAEAADTAKLLHDLQQQMTKERTTYGDKVQATMKKVATANNLETAQKATEDLKAASPAPPHNVVPLPLDVSGPGPGAGSGTFDQASIERVVNSRKAGVKRVCLERSASTASSTRIATTLTIAPNGTVQNVSSEGNDPAVAKCIEQQLRTWSFPAPGEVKTVQIPFVFVRQ